MLLDIHGRFIYNSVIFKINKNNKSSNQINCLIKLVNVEIREKKDSMYTNIKSSKSKKLLVLNVIQLYYS